MIQFTARIRAGMYLNMWYRARSACSEPYTHTFITEMATETYAPRARNHNLQHNIITTMFRMIRSNGLSNCH